MSHSGARFFRLGDTQTCVHRVHNFGTNAADLREALADELRSRKTRKRLVVALSERIKFLESEGAKVETSEGAEEVAA